MYKPSKYRILTGLCPDAKCGAQLFFPSYESSIECSECEQRHERQTIRNVEEASDTAVAIHVLRSFLTGGPFPKKGDDMVCLQKVYFLLVKSFTCILFLVVY